MSTTDISHGTQESDVDGVLAEYFRRIDNHETVDREAFIAAHPEAADELRAFFAGADLVEQMAGPPAGTPEGRTLLSDLQSASASCDTTRSVAAETQAPQRLKGNAAAEPPPIEFGRYRLLKPLGQGAMGAVYLAHDSQLDRQVALKMPKFDSADREQLLTRFYAEARAAATISHPHICPVFDVGEQEGRHFITMAYVEGQPLSRYIDPDMLQPEKNIATLVRKLALALQEAHRKGVVHRDLKPGNIMIDRRNEPVIMDFGLARRVDAAAADQARATQSGELLGTPAYMSPEQVRGETDRVGPATDVYSLGVILYELLTGRLPFAGSIGSVLGQILHLDAPPVTNFRPDADPRLIDLCKRMMAKSIEERCGSMAEVAEALAAILKAPAARKGPTEGPPKQPPAAEKKAAAPVKGFRSGDAAALIDAARACVDGFDYAQAVEILLQIPGSYRNEEAERLLKKARSLQEEIDFLIGDMEKAKVTKDYKGLKENLKRLLKIKPGYAPAKEMLEELNTYGRGGRIGGGAGEAGQYHKDEGILRPLVVGGLVVALLAGVIFGAVTIYLKTQTGTIKVTVYDPSVKVSLDNEVLTIDDGTTATTVRVGDHTLVVQQPGLKTQALDFEVEKGESKVFRVELVGGELAIGSGTGSAAIIGQVEQRSADSTTEAAAAAIPQQSATDDSTTVYLADLKPSDVLVDFDLTGAAAMTVISAGGVVSEHGLMTHPKGGLRTPPAGYVVYPLAGKYIEFKGSVAVGDSAGVEEIPTALHFIVRGDGKLLWESRPLKKKGESQDFAVSVAAVNELEIRCEAESILHSHAVWLEPRLIAASGPVEAPTQPAPMPSADEVFLTELSPIDSRAMFGLWFNKVSTRGKVSEHGIITHPFYGSPPSGYVTYDIGGVCRELQGAAAINDTAGVETTSIELRFSVIGDGKSLWQSRPMRRRGESEPFVIDVTGVRRLELRCDAPSTDNAHGAWLEPRLSGTGIRSPLVVAMPAVIPLEGHGATLRAVDMSDDGRFAASGGDDQSVRIWDAESGETLHTLLGHGARILAVAFSPDGEVLASGGEDGIIRTWNVQTGSLTAELKGHSKQVRRMEFSRDGQHLTSCGNEVIVWNVSTRRPIKTFQRNRGAIHSVSLSPDARFVASVADDNKIIIGNVQTGRETKALDLQATGWCVDYSVDGRTIICGESDGSVLIWDPATNETKQIQSAQSISINGMEVFPDGRRLVTTDWSGMVKIWDLNTLDLIDQCYAEGDQFEVACGSGRIIAIGGATSPYLRLWRPQD